MSAFEKSSPANEGLGYIFIAIALVIIMAGCHYFCESNPSSLNYVPKPTPTVHP